MKTRMIAVLGIGAALLVGSAFVASASPVRDVPVSADLQAYFTAHGVDNALPQMIEDYMRPYIGVMGDDLVLSLGSTEWQFTEGAGVPTALTQLR
jgi:hypothetical protein